MFSRFEGNIYVETDAQHYAMFGPITEKDGIRVVAVNDDDHYTLTSRCAKEWLDLKEISKEKLKVYNDIRIKSAGQSTHITNSPNENYSWLSTYTNGSKKSSILQLDDDTSVYTSKSFPSRLAMVIMSENVVIFIHFDGFVSMRTMNCLYPNEKLLVRELKKINSRKRMYCCFSRSSEKHSATYPFNEPEFYFEQNMKQHTLKGNFLHKY